MAALLDLLETELMAAKEVIAVGEIAEVSEYQGRCKAYQDLIRKIERTPIAAEKRTAA